ncbi:MAG: AAA family ATPase [Verrucomicrobiota bacterium]
MNEDKTLICTVGFPRAGKSTWAKKWGKDNSAPIVNPDSIWVALHGQPFAAEAEPFVWAIAKTMVRSLFLAGHHAVILDATNTTRKRRDEWQSKDWKTVFHVIDTTPVECIKRATETNEDLIPVIERMAEQYEPVDEVEEGSVISDEDQLASMMETAYLRSSRRNAERLRRSLADSRNGETVKRKLAGEKIEDDPRFLKRIAQSRDQAAKGKTTPLEEVDQQD